MRPASTAAPFFSVIVLNWNGRQFLGECLGSVLKQSYADFETIVVDNGSTDDSVGYVTDSFRDNVRVISLPENRGYAGGNNAGIAKANGKYLVLLNNDTAVAPGWLLAISEAIHRHPDAGMFTPKILNYYRRDEIDNTGHVVYPDGLARGRDRLETDDGRFDEEGETFYPSGCACVYRKDMLDQIGMLDETFFAYGEDVDLGLRARWAGWKCYYVPAAVVYHKYSGTVGKYSPLKAYFVERNRLWILVKNFPLREVMLSPLFTCYRYCMHIAGALSGRGASGNMAREFPIFSIFITMFRAEIAALVGLPRVLRQRCQLRAHRRITAREFRGLLMRFSMSAREAAFKD